jgi:hypothetical protein
MLPSLPPNRSRAAPLSHHDATHYSFTVILPQSAHTAKRLGHGHREPSRIRRPLLSSVLPHAFAINTASSFKPLAAGCRGETARVSCGTASWVLPYCAPRSQRSGRIGGASSQFPDRLTSILKWGTMLQTLPRGTRTHGRCLAQKMSRCSSYLAQQMARCSSDLRCRD